MMKLTKTEAIQQHRKMWDWIVTETKKRKYPVSKADYFDELDLEPIPYGCFCCNYARDTAERTAFKEYTAFPSICNYCPLDWGRTRCSCNTFMRTGLYYKWEQARYKNKYRKAAKLAKKIAELPEK